MRLCPSAFAHRLSRLRDPTTQKIPVQPRTSREAFGLSGRTGHTRLIETKIEASDEVDRILPGFRTIASSVKVTRLIVELARTGLTEEAENLRKKALATVDDPKIREAGK